MHCLNLKITYQCTNHCSFCFASHLTEERISADGLTIGLRDGYSKGCRELVLSGGEPTQYPELMMHMLSLASELGYEKYIIQSNGSGFSDNPRLIKFISDFSSTREVCVSFSVHGATAEVHDEMCSKNGAFLKLIDGMRKVKQFTACSIYTNTVVSRINIRHLKDVAKLILPFQPAVLQYSMMHLSSPSELSTGLLESAMAIREVAPSIPVEILRTEGIPYCLMHGYERCVGESYWPDKLDLYNKDNDYRSDFKQLDVGMRWKHSKCLKCIMNSLCMGIWKEHAQEFIDAGIRPIS